MIKLSSALIALGLAAACGSDKKTDPVATTTATTWTTVQPILQKSCVNAKCHATNGTGGTTLDLSTITEANFKMTNTKSRLVAGDMPTPGNPEGLTLSAADKTTILNFLDGK